MGRQSPAAGRRLLCGYVRCDAAVYARVFVCGVRIVVVVVGVVAVVFHVGGGARGCLYDGRQGEFGYR